MENKIETLKTMVGFLDLASDYFDEADVLTITYREPDWLRIQVYDPEIVKQLDGWQTGHYIDDSMEVYAYLGDIKVFALYKETK